MEEAYSGRLIIKSFNREGSSSQRVHELSDKLARASRRADFATNAISPLIRFIIRLAQVLIAVVAGGMLVGGQITIGVFQAFFQYIHVLIAVVAGGMLVGGQITIGVFQAFFQYIHQASEPLTQLSFTINTLQKALASVERVFDILDEEEVEPDPLPEVAARLPAAVEGRVDFSRVRFGYNPEKPLMRDVTFHVKPGQKVAIVGARPAARGCREASRRRGRARGL